jgi:RHS repeat-associated protein
VLDLDFDNDCDSSDETVFDSLPHTGTVVHPARRSSLLGQPFAHQGLFLDPEIGSYHNRARQYHPTFRRLLQRDPQAAIPLPALGYVEGMSMYAALRFSPLQRVDPSGHQSVAWLLGSGGGWPSLPDPLCCLRDILRELRGDYNPITGKKDGISWGYIHCVDHCAMVKSGNCGGRLGSQIAGILVEVYQVNVCVTGQNRGECLSAWQASDWWDNELGRRCGATNPESCGACCAGKMGGKTDRALPEGPESSRPFGPYADKAVPEQPTGPWSPPGGLPMPEEWGPEMGPDGAPPPWRPNPGLSGRVPDSLRP